MSALLREAVWAKGHPVRGLDRTKWCADDYGNLLRSTDYGDRSSPYGWEMDHYPVPNAFGGPDTVSNLRPLSCSANARHGAQLGNALKREAPAQPFGFRGNALSPRGLFGSSARNR